jgi:hypothetical protein
LITYQIIINGQLCGGDKALPNNDNDDDEDDDNDEHDEMDPCLMMMFP